jgi:hypothetical protein
MMIVADSRIESPWNWDLQSRRAVSFNSFRKACTEQYRSFKSSIHHLNHHQNLCCLPVTPRASRLSLYFRHLWAHSNTHKEAAVERFSPIHF